MFMLFYLYNWQLWNISCRHHLDDFTRCCITVKLKERWKITDVARELDFVHSVISQLWRAFQRTRICSKHHRKSCLSAWHPKKVLPQVSRHPKKTVARPLHQGGLYTQRLFLCVLLSRAIASVCNAAFSIGIELRITVFVYTCQMGVSSVCFLIVNENWSGLWCLSSRKYPWKESEKSAQA